MNIRTHLVGLLVTLLPIRGLNALEPFSLQAHCLATIFQDRTYAGNLLFSDMINITKEELPFWKYAFNDFIKSYPNFSDKDLETMCLIHQFRHTPVLSNKGAYELLKNNPVVAEVLLILRAKDNGSAAALTTIADLIRHISTFENRPVPLMNLLMKHAPALINSSHGHHQCSPLDQAVRSNNVPLTMWLLGQGANPNHKNAAGRTPLHAAAANPDTHESIIFALLDHGADITSMENSFEGAPISMRPLCPITEAQTRENERFVDAVERWQESRKDRVPPYKSSCLLL